MRNSNNKNYRSRFIFINFRKKHKFIRFFLFLGCIFAVFILYLQFLVTPLIVETCNASVKVSATKCINYAIAQAMNQNISYDDLISIVKDSNGNINMIQANSVQINILSKFINKVAIAELSKFSNNALQILGAFSGISVFAGFGPMVSIEIFPYGDVHCSFISEFSSAGINQTIHKIYLSVDTNIRVVLPTKTVSVKNAGQVVLCESLIVGAIPEVYLQSGKLSEMLDLIPN